MTVRDAFKLALRSIQAIASGETPTAEEAQDGLEVLNLMTESWGSEGLDIPQYDSIDDDLNLGPGYIWALIRNWAVELAPEYGKTVSAELGMSAVNSKEVIKRANKKEQTLECDDGVLRIQQIVDINNFGG